ncbi:1,4-alpha-glucan branching enzyme GlgB [Trichinella spiralis]|uniref:1,4-alpha-glucan branching enzyme GlgB n=1 Tax=Trichinella spiralis TaxID=6334 RepID=A0ABR3KVV6_TRISP
MSPYLPSDIADILEDRFSIIIAVKHLGMSYCGKVDDLIFHQSLTTVKLQLFYTKNLMLTLRLAAFISCDIAILVSGHAQGDNLLCDRLACRMPPKKKKL